MIKNLSIFLFFCVILTSKEWKFKAPHASQIEGRIGTIGQFQDERLRLDIGNSFELSRFDAFGGFENLSLGGDFMTFTRLRSEGKFKFPVETTDYYFGINSIYYFKTFGNVSNLRVRLAHISSHIIDGFADESGQLSRLPFTYSREFIDFLYITEIYENLRIYLGSNFIFSTIPDNVNLIEPQIGFDYKIDLFSNIQFRVGYDLRLLGTDNNYRGASASQFGFLLKTNQNFEKGIYIGYYFYEGYSMHGMFIGEHDSYSGLGFQIYY